MMLNVPNVNIKRPVVREWANLNWRVVRMRAVVRKRILAIYLGRS